MQFNDLLDAASIDPKEVLILRHRPQETELREVLPWLASESPDIFNAYQQTQGPIVEKSMTRAKFVASFIGHKAGKAVFIGLYKVGDTTPLSFKQFWEVGANLKLKEFGMRGMSAERDTTLWFELTQIDFRLDWKGKLIVLWPGIERSWYRWADRKGNELQIHAIVEDSILDRQMPEWNRLTVSWKKLGILPTRWRDKLREWKGIYFILDARDGKGYVGSAYGDENLLGRWDNYAASGHGDNKRLLERDPKTFLFSILQRVSPDMEPSDVQDLETSWKVRLHTREFGLNGN